MAVALRKESVDRNMGERSQLYQTVVALRKESVDRNAITTLPSTSLPESLSVRRAWIEIIYAVRDYTSPLVALRKESVDRNADVVAE